jgi:8-oxo-dGTP pyrophosphatase MutT (NUDIX family)
VPAVHADAVQVLGRWQPPTAEQGALRDAYLAHLHAHTDATSRTCTAGHLTASALVWQESAIGPRVLLTLHARIGRWLQMGGHIEGADANLAAAALREAVEESGIADLTLIPEPATLDRHRVNCRSGDGYVDLDHLDVQYVALAPHSAKARASVESTAVTWFPVVDGRIEGCAVDESVARLVAAAWDRLGR